MMAGGSLARGGRDEGEPMSAENAQALEGAYAAFARSLHGQSASVGPC